MHQTKAGLINYKAKKLGNSPVSDHGRQWRKFVNTYLCQFADLIFEVGVDMDTWMFVGDVLKLHLC